MGYDVLPNLRQLVRHVKELYNDTKWDKKSIDRGDDYFAIWGWCKDGTYDVALVRKFKSGIGVKVMSEFSCPVIQPSQTFLKSRPPITLEAERKLKEIEGLQSLVLLIMKIQY